MRHGLLCSFVRVKVGHSHQSTNSRRARHRPAGAPDQLSRACKSELPIQGNRYSLINSLCEGLGHSTLETCPADQRFVTFVKLGSVWSSGGLGALFASSEDRRRLHRSIRRQRTGALHRCGRKISLQSWRGHLDPPFRTRVLRRLSSTAAGNDHRRHSTAARRHSRTRCHSCQPAAPRASLHRKRGALLDADRRILQRAVDGGVMSFTPGAGLSCVLSILLYGRGQMQTSHRLLGLSQEGICAVCSLKGGNRGLRSRMPNCATERAFIVYV